MKHIIHINCREKELNNIRNKHLEYIEEKKKQVSSLENQVAFCIYQKVLPNLLSRAFVKAQYDTVIYTLAMKYPDHNAITCPKRNLEK